MLKAKSSKKRVALPQHYHVKKGDTVMVIAGKDKGKTGVIKRVFRSKGKVLVEGLNIVKKAVRPNPMLGQRGGIVEMEAPLNVSKVMLFDTKNNQASRAKVEIVNGKAVRASKKSGEHFDV
ncbi:MAG: ribosomal protein [Vampirovibrio sp.]|jgi:large subunit ribosomal protein L24|nr:ribosomal protein [Vampirovibrio sp.]